MFDFWNMIVKGTTFPNVSYRNNEHQLSTFWLTGILVGILITCVIHTTVLQLYAIYYLCFINKETETQKC